MAVEPKKLTDADVMTGFNPDRAVTAEEIEAQQAEGKSVTPEPEGSSGEPGAPTAPEESEVTLDGRRLKAPRELADAFTREINRRDGTRGAELQMLRERLARLEGAASATATPSTPDAPPEPVVPDPDLQIENPAEYQKQMLAFIEHQQTKRTQALATRYEEAEAVKEQETARRAAWAAHCDKFYSSPDNEVLRDNKDIVDLVLEKNKELLAPLSVEDGFKELSRLAKERLAKVTGVAPKLRAQAQKPPTLEGSARRDSAAAPQAKDEGPGSMTQALKARRLAAAGSFAKGGSGSPTRR